MAEKLTQVQVYLPERRIAALKILAEDRGVSLSGICKLAIGEYLEFAAAFLDGQSKALQDPDTYIINRGLREA